MKFIISLLLIGLVPGPGRGADEGITKKLLVSEYIKAGKVREARRLSLVTGLRPNITSYSGFLTVHEDCGSNMFYWFFPSKNDPENDAVTLWLGEGDAIAHELIKQRGLFYLDINGALQLRNYSWNSNSSVLYIDNPVGVGFSYTENEECYCTSNAEIGEELFEALQQFFLLFPELQKNPFYIFGESLAGKFVTALAHAIHNSRNTKMNLKGIAIGNGWLDPVNQVDLSPLPYQLGLIDWNYKNYLAKEEGNIKKLIGAGMYVEADRLDNFIHGDALLEKVSYTSTYNFMRNKELDLPDFGELAKSPEIRELLHVGDATWHGYHNTTFVDYLEADMMRSMRPWLEELVEHYQVVLYNGQLDLTFPYVQTINYVRKMKWSGAKEYRTAQRSHWYVGNKLAGYVKTVKKFTEILVRNAGKRAVADQPEWMLDLYYRVIFGLF